MSTTCQELLIIHHLNHPRTLLLGLGDFVEETTEVDELVFVETHFLRLTRGTYLYQPLDKILDTAVLQYFGTGSYRLVYSHLRRTNKSIIVWTRLVSRLSSEKNFLSTFCARSYQTQGLIFSYKKLSMKITMVDLFSRAKGLPSLDGSMRGNFPGEWKLVLSWNKGWL